MSPIIFLDIDGVLNCSHSTPYLGNFVGIDEDKLVRLKEIVIATNAKIVLTSSWKTHWSMHNKKSQDKFGNEIDKRFSEYDILPIGKTRDNGWNRGEGIISWVKNKNLTYWVVIDDEIFPDFQENGIYPHTVKTSWYHTEGGLQKQHVRQAIDILNGNLNKDLYFPNTANHN